MLRGDSGDRILDAADNTVAAVGALSLSTTIPPEWEALKPKIVKAAESPPDLTSLKDFVQIAVQHNMQLDEQVLWTGGLLHVPLYDALVEVCYDYDELARLFPNEP